MTFNTFMGNFVSHLKAVYDDDFVSVPSDWLRMSKSDGVEGFKTQLKQLFDKSWSSLKAQAIKQ